VFQHDGPDCNAGLCPPGFHNTYEFIFETAWNATGLEGLMKFNETCVRTRGRKRSAFVLSNHFATNSLGLPEKAIAEEVNMAVNIRNRADACMEMLDRQINLLAVDFWSVGDTLQVVHEYNEALPAITEAPSMSPIPSASPTTAPVPPTLPPSTAPPVQEPTLAATTPPSPAPSLAPSDGVVPTPDVLETMDESLAPSSEFVDTFLPTGTIAPVPVSTPVASPIAQDSETFTPVPSPMQVLEDTATFVPSSTTVLDEVTPFSTISEPDSPTRLERSEQEHKMFKHLFHNDFP